MTTPADYATALAPRGPHFAGVGPADLKEAASDWHAQFGDALGQAVAYMSAGVWNPLTAAELADAGVTPASLAVAALRLGPGTRREAAGLGLAFALSNGDVSVQRVADDLRRSAG